MMAGAGGRYRDSRAEPAVSTSAGGPYAKDQEGHGDARDDDDDDAVGWGGKTKYLIRVDWAPNRRSLSLVGTQCCHAPVPQ
jgi:hypothetical protein